MAAIGQRAATINICAAPFDKRTQKFKKITEGPDPVRLAFTSGHTFIVGEEFIPIPAGPGGEFWKAAFAAGCISEEALTKAIERQKQGKPSAILGDGAKKDLSNLSAEERKALAKEKIEQMYATKDPSHFTRDDLPMTEKLSELCGFTVSAAERDDWTIEYLAEQEQRDELAATGGKPIE